MSDKKQVTSKNVLWINYQIEKIFSYPLIILGVLGIIGILIRLYYFPFNIPLTLDATGYFWYAMDMSLLGKFPEEYNFPNTSWSSFLSIFFSLINSTNFLDYMNLQRYLSIAISVLTIIPVYLTCTRFFNKSYSLLGAALFVFDPRIIQNSLSGITEPPYILLGSLVLFFILSKKVTRVYAAFGITALFSLVRYEGLFAIVAISIIFFLRFRNDRKVIPKYFVAMAIFLLILLPMAYVRMNTTVYVSNDEVIHLKENGLHGLLSHAIGSPVAYYGSSIAGLVDRPSLSELVSKSLSYFSQYLVWVMIPIFGFFAPSGIMLFAKKWDYRKTVILLFSIFLILPALYAYSRGFQDTRYLFVMFPIFAILSLYTVEKINERIRNFGLIWLVVISFILSVSFLFLDYKNFDYEHEIQAFEISKHIASIAKGTNDYYPEAKFASMSELNNYDFPILSSTVSKGPKLFSTDGFKSLKEFVVANREKGLSHLVVDNSKVRPKFLHDVFVNENMYPFLIKEFDSLEYGYTYHVKVYRIEYEKFKK